MRGGSFYKMALASCAAALLVGFENRGRAGDPLDDYDPTAEWEQKDTPSVPRHPVEDHGLERKLREEWLRLRENWPLQRRMFLMERAEYKQQAEKLSKKSPPRPLAGSGAEATPAEGIPSASGREKRQVGEAGSGHLDESLPLETPPVPVKRDVQSTPLTTDETSGGDSAEQRPRESMPAAQNKQADSRDEQGPSEEEILRQVEERQKKEQMELEKKAGLVEGEDGQFIDPELQEEMSKDE